MLFPPLMRPAPPRASPRRRWNRRLRIAIRPPCPTLCGELLACAGATRIRYAFRANGEVVLQRVSPDPIEEDPALAPFLALQEQDIASHPERLQPLGADLVRPLRDLVGASEVDLDEALPHDEPV